MKRNPSIYLSFYSSIYSIILSSSYPFFSAQCPPFSWISKTLLPRIILLHLCTFWLYNERWQLESQKELHNQRPMIPLGRAGSPLSRVCAKLEADVGCHRALTRLLECPSRASAPSCHAHVSLSQPAQHHTTPWDVLEPSATINEKNSLSCFSNDQAQSCGPTIRCTSFITLFFLYVCLSLLLVLVLSFSLSAFPSVSSHPSPPFFSSHLCLSVQLHPSFSPQSDFLP